MKAATRISAAQRWLGPLLGERRRRTLDLHAGEAVQADDLDQGANLGLCPADKHLESLHSQAARQDGEVQHQRGIGEHELGEIDDHITLGADRPGQRPPAPPLGVAVLIAAAAEGGRLVIEVDDR